MKRLLSAFLILTLSLGLLIGCGGAEGLKTSASGKLTAADADSPEKGENLIESENAAPTGEDGTDLEEIWLSESDESMFTKRDLRDEYDESTAVVIHLTDGDISTGSDSVSVEGSTVTLREEAVYLISGTLSDGMIIVDAPESAKIQLVFAGVDITSSSSAALYVRQADKVVITLKEGTENSLSNGGVFTPIDENNIDGALFSKEDLSLNGGGALTLNSPAGHGLVCKDDLVFTGGSYVINAASHALDANDSVRITEAALSIDAGKDAIHCENDEDAEKGFVYISGGTICAEAEGDGVSASGAMQISGGSIELLAGGGSENGSRESSAFFGGFMGGVHGVRPEMPEEPMLQNEESSADEESGTSMKGLKSTGCMLISGGSFIINSADDAIHSDSSLRIEGGRFTLGSGDDAVHAENSLSILDGVLDISESYEGLEALHIELSGGLINITATDDGLNAAGGVDQSGVTGGRDGMFGVPGGMGGGPAQPGTDPGQHGEVPERPTGGDRPMGEGPGGGFGGMTPASEGSIVISGGELRITAYGDGIDANGSLEISGGAICVTGPDYGDTATLDYDLSAVISGGSFIGTGALAMAQTLSGEGQGVISLQTGSRAAGTEIVLKDADGNILMSHKAGLDFSLVILSCPGLEKGESYSVTIGESSGIFEAG